MTTKQRQRLLVNNVEINTEIEVIKPIQSEKLLGIVIQNYLKWSDYILKDDKSLVRQLTTRLSALKLVSDVASFKVRLMIANGIFSSKLIFQISVWGGAESYLLDALQIVQNKAARFVARGERFTPVIDLLKQCGWLSVRQLAFYHSVLLIKKTLNTSILSILMTSLLWSSHTTLD